MPLFRKKYSVSEVLESSKKELVEGLGDLLIALIHFGNHLDQSLSTDAEDDIQLLIVVKQINKPTLDRLADSYAKIQGRGQIAPMFLTQGELESSTDVFPTIFLEMTHFYDLLHGEDVLKKLQIETPYLRIRCEQALKNLLFRLQASYVTRNQDSDFLGNLVHTNFQNLLKIFHSVRVLFGEEFSQSREETITWAADQLKLDLDLLKVLEQNDAHPTSSRETLLDLLAALIKIVADAAAVVDRIQESVELIESGEA